MRAQTTLPAFPSLVQLFLRIKHPTIDVDVVTSTLGITPEHAHNAGSANENRGNKGSHTDSYWLADVTNAYEDIYGTRMDVASKATVLKPLGIAKEDVRTLAGGGPIDIQILTTLRRLQQHASFLAKIGIENGSVTLVVERLRRLGPFTLASATAARLGELGISLEVDD